MANPLLMPALSPTMAEGVLVRWHRSEGDSFRAGDLLAEVETDKAVMELEASEDGILGRILVTAEDGETTPVGAPIALILQEGEEASALESLAASLESTSPETPEAAPAPAFLSLHPTQRQAATKRQQLQAQLRNILRHRWHKPPSHHRWKKGK